MSKNSESSSAPRLRFPEFRDAAPWVQYHLAHFIAALDAGVSVNAGDRPAGGSEIGVLKTSCVSKGVFEPEENKVVVAPEEQQRAREPVTGDTIIISRMNTPALVGANAYVEFDIPNLFLPDRLWAAKPTKYGSMRFLSYVLASDVGRARLSATAGGTSGTMKNISKSGVLEIEIAAPSLDEQKRIADCLTSLDEVIDAQRRKVEALKAHKLGLMQQLFPLEGETIPRLRFPEFRKGPAWIRKKIGAMLEDRSRPIDMADNEEYSLVTVKRRYGGVVSREQLKGSDIKVKSQFIVKAQDFLISKRQIVHNACGLVPRELDGSIVSNEYSVLGPRPGCDIEFFNYFAQQPSVSTSFLQSSVGIVIEKMLFKLDSWLRLEFVFPAIEEQRKIASCLRSAEDNIATATNLFESLELHKKSLMQQLFPSSEPA